MNIKRHIDVDITVESFHFPVNSIDAGGPNLDRMRSGEKPKRCSSFGNAAGKCRLRKST